MSDETAIGPAGAPDGGRHPRSGAGISSPLQARAEFLKNWDWNAVVSINRGACERGRAQHGVNSEAGAACAADWEILRYQALTLGETFDRLRSFHRRAPFLFFNGNTFAAIGRELSFALFSDLVPGRKREVGSAVAHYIAGVLDREAMVQIIETLCQAADWKPGDRAKTLRGTLHGVILRVLEVGHVVWQAIVAKSFWQAFGESLDDKEFTRSREGGGLNNLLNYGYAVMLSTVLQKLFGVGLDPTFGISHVARERSTPLAYDLMEPFRPCVDWRVYQWVKKHPDRAQWEVTKEFRGWVTGFPLERVGYLEFTLEIQGVIEGVVRGFRHAVMNNQPRQYKPWTPKGSKWIS